VFLAEKIIFFRAGVMGIANAQRSLDVIRSVTEFISQPQYADVVVMLGLVRQLPLLASHFDVCRQRCRAGIEMIDPLSSDLVA
jgi:hypothetical protein